MHDSCAAWRCARGPGWPAPVRCSAMAAATSPWRFPPPTPFRTWLNAACRPCPCCTKPASTRCSRRPPNPANRPSWRLCGTPNRSPGATATVAPASAKRRPSGANGWPAPNCRPARPAVTDPYSFKPASMKILISTDIEGVAGVFHAEQTRPGNGEYERARVWMTGEANAAIEAAFDGGADEVLVNDSHGGFRNLLPDALDARARVVLGKPRYLGMMGGLEESCDAVCLVGYHARSQARGILAHTINSFAYARIFINGVELG